MSTWVFCPTVDSHRTPIPWWQHDRVLGNSGVGVVGRISCPSSRKSTFPNGICIDGCACMRAPLHRTWLRILVAVKSTPKRIVYIIVYRCGRCVFRTHNFNRSPWFIHVLWTVRQKYTSLLVSPDIICCYLRRNSLGNLPASKGLPGISF